jgi:branched-chain amino acid aminotransferase
MTGTAAEVTPMRELDQRRLGTGKPGPITTALQTAFARIVRGNEPRYRSWLSAVN